MNCKKYVYAVAALGMLISPVMGQSVLIKNGAKVAFSKPRPAVSGRLGYAAVNDISHRDALKDLHGLDQILKARVRRSLLNWYGRNEEGISYPMNDSYLPGFEEDWTVALEEYAEANGGRNFFADMQPVLARMYPGALFTPQYAVSFEDVLLFSRRPTQKGLPLGKQFVAAWQDKNIPGHLPGFAVVRVEGKRSRPKDVLILDISERKVYSLFKSQGIGVAQALKSRKEYWAFWHRKAAKRLERQGFLIDEKKNKITKDGVVWTNIDELPNPAVFWHAWHNGLKIQFNRGWTGKVVGPEK